MTPPWVTQLAAALRERPAGPVRLDARLAPMLRQLADTLALGRDRAAAVSGPALLFAALAEHARSGGDAAPVIALLCERQARQAADLLTAIAGQSDAPRIAALLAHPGDADRERLMRDLVNLTLAYAKARCRRYRDDRRYPAQIGTLGEFARLPRLTRADVEADLTAICAEGAPIDFYTATSSTSTGRALLVPHCRQEYFAMGARGGQGTGGAQAGAAMRPDRGMTLRLMPAARLIGAPIGADDTILATYEANAVRETRVDIWDYVAGQVFLTFPSPAGERPVTAIHATPAVGLILLTKYMLQRGLDPRESAVRTLIVTGSWIGPRTARWMAEAWNARLETTYSFSELAGGAITCPRHPGRYHFAANLLAEVLCADGNPVADGEQGRIHLTGLYPYQQSATFLRYEIGDWGRWHAPGRCDCGIAAPAVDLLGRNADVIALTTRDGRTWPIAPVPVRNALDAFDCVPKIPRPQYKLGVDDSGETPALTVDVECYALAGAAWQQRTRAAIREAILGEDETVRRLSETGAIELDVRLHSRSKLTSTLRVI